MVRRSVSGLVVVDFFVGGYRISGHLVAGGKTVGDLLNDRLRSYLELNDVYISRINNPGEIVATYAMAELLKDNVFFAIVPSKERAAQVGKLVSYFGRHRRRVWLVLSAFEIEGDLPVAGLSLDPEAFLATRESDYILILNGTARAAAWPEVTFSGEVFLVNKRSIDLFCLDKR